MEIELLEIRDFLLAHPPFDRLDSDTVATLPRHITIRYLRRGAPFPPADTPRAALYLIRSGAIELRDTAGQLLEILTEGELHFDHCAALEERLACDGHAKEDTLLYQIPCELIATLRSRFAALDHYFARSLTERLHHALAALREGHASELLTVRCGELVQRAPITAPADISIRAAAQLMTEQHISALLITRDERIEGIVTDRDLRSRCLAAGLAPEQPVSTIMSRALHKLSADSSGYEALLTMTRLAIHHLPIIDHGRTVGMLSSSDLIRHQGFNAVHLVSAIRRCDSAPAVARAAARLPELQLQLLAAGASGYQLGKAISTVTDAITVRLLTLAEAQLGPPPVPYTWLVFGSQARQEQTVHSDQDNGLLLDDRYRPEQAPYFAALAEFVNSHLDHCGLRLCDGDVLARNPQWRQPLAVWQRYFSEWVGTPQPRALMHASIFFDLRALHGATPLAERLRAHMLALTRGNTLFLAHLTANALHHRPPLGFFRQLVLIRDGVHDATLDIKQHGIIPLVDLARVHALGCGIPEQNSHDRLMAAHEERVVSRDSSASLADALELLTLLRARHQAEQIRRGLAPDNFVAPAQLSALERHHLKDAFSLIATLQQALAQRYQSERFA